METIRIQNFRSIVDSKEIHLNELNLLIGKNSSGKSSFLRLFPMLKESSRHELRGPILWFDETYDFGGYQTAISRNRTEDSIVFSFEWRHSDDKRSSSDDLLYYYPLDLKSGSLFRVSISISKEEQLVFLKKLTIQIDDNTSIIINSTGYESDVEILIDDRRVNTRAKWNYNSKALLPSLHILNKTIDVPKLVTSLLGLEPDEEKKFHFSVLYFNHICLTEREFDSYLRTVARKGNISFKPSELDKGSQNYKVLLDYFLSTSVRVYTDYVNQYISRYFSHSYYITPLRFNFLRYMRNRELSIDYIESSGRNVMEYVLSLSDDQRAHYSSFLQKTLGVEVEVIGEDNKSIVVTNKDGERDNIVDIGYGFSQVLPIATTLWDRAFMNKDSSTVETIVIEQPEVHLHPAMQAELAKLFISAIELAKMRGKRLCLIIETHSSRLVNRIGRCIYNNNNGIGDEEGIQSISRSSVSLFLFEKSDGITTISQREYGEDGRIKEWPIGFLD